MSAKIRPLIMMEVLLLAALAMSVKAVFGLVAWRYAGPLTLLVLLSGLTVYFKARGLSWREYGLVRLPKLKSWLLLPFQSLLAVIAILGTGVAAASLGGALGFEFMTQEPEGVMDRFGAVADGSLPHYLLWLAIAIFAAGLGEELFFRGVVHGSFAKSIGDQKASIVDSLAFALTHIAHFGLVFINGNWTFYFVPTLIWVIGMFLVSIVFFQMKKSSGSILGAILCHAGFNLGMIYCIFYLV